MEPQFVSPEFQTDHPEVGESVLSNPNVGFDASPSPEALIASPEQAKNMEQLSVDHHGAAAPLVQQPVALPVVDNTQTQAAVVTSTTPATARDEDIIEKEWVSKVKSIISSTPNDPHKQQSMMSRLMADYILKRYGRKIGETGGK